MTGGRVRAWRRAASTCALAGAILPLSAAASAEPAEVAGIIVTGTRIAQPDSPPGSPVAAIDGEAFRLANAATLEALLSRQPQFVPSVTDMANIANPGAATLDLRGLGSFRTLVLVDGHRMASFNPGGVTDVNAIPVALIKRVDILTGGASAVHGSDAVAGVVNVLLDDRLSGLRLDGSSRITARGDGALRDVSATWGGALAGRGHIVLLGGYTRRSAVLQGARSFARDTLSSQDLGPAGGSITANPTVIANSFIADGNSLYQIAPDDRLVPFYQSYNLAPSNYLAVPLDRWTANLIGDYALGDGATLFLRGSYMQAQVDKQAAPTGTFGYPFRIYPGNPYLTAQQRALLFGGAGPVNADGSITLSILRRFTESGERTVSYDNAVWQALGGLRGRAAGLHWEVFAQYAGTHRTIRYANDISYARVARALDAVMTPAGIACRDPGGGCRPLNLFTAAPVPADVLAFVAADGRQGDRTSQFVAGGSLSGDLGPAGFAAGAEYRRESALTMVDAAYGSGDLIGYGQGRAFPAFAFDVRELFAELRAPLTRSLRLELGFRQADYSTAGPASAFKAGAQWTPVDGLTFSAMAQRAVRAPNLYEYAAPRSAGLDIVAVDPCAGAGPGGDAALAALCVATGAPPSQIGRIAAPPLGYVNAFFGGNRALTAERSNSVTAGVQVAPAAIPGLSVALDYYNIRIRNAIESFGVSAQTIVNGCYLVARDAGSDFCRAIIRNSVSGALSGGLDTGISEMMANAATVETAGIDVDARYARALGRGAIALALGGTYVDRYVRQGVGIVPATQCAGQFGFACGMAPLPRWKHVASLRYDIGPFSWQARWRHIGPVRADARTDILVRRLPAYDYLDATLSWTLRDGLVFRLGAENLFDTGPPLVGSAAGSAIVNAANTFPTVYDVLGTTFFASVSARF